MKLRWLILRMLRLSKFSEPGFPFFDLAALFSWWGEVLFLPFNDGRFDVEMRGSYILLNLRVLGMLWFRHGLFFLILFFLFVLEAGHQHYIMLFFELFLRFCWGDNLFLAFWLFFMNYLCFLSLRLLFLTLLSQFNNLLMIIFLIFKLLLTINFDFNNIFLIILGKKLILIELIDSWHFRFLYLPIFLSSLFLHDDLSWSNRHFLNIDLSMMVLGGIEGHLELRLLLHLSTWFSVNFSHDYMLLWRRYLPS